MERECIVKEKKKLKKVKKDGVTCEKEINKAKAVMEKKGRTYNPQAKMDLRKTKHLPNWTPADLRAMMKWKAPKQPNLPATRGDLVEVWEEVKDLTPPPSNDGHWEQSKEDELVKFQNNGRYTIERTYIMRRSERQKRRSYLSRYQNYNPEVLFK